MKPKPFTQAQAELIYELDCMHYLHEDAHIEPLLAFPRRDNRDNGLRRTLTNLAEQGYFTKLPGPFSVYVPNLDKIKASWDAWSAKNNWPNPVDYFSR